MLSVLERSFKGKIVVPTVMILATLLGAMSFFMSVQFSRFGNKLISDRLNTSSAGMNLFLGTSISNTQAAAISMSLNYEAIKAINSRDREAILKVFAPTLKLYKIDYYTIVDAKGNVLARTHAPDIHGDSVLNQKSISDAIAGKVKTYFEEGSIVKVSVHTGVPVYDQTGRMIGVISAGVRFDIDKTVDYLKEQLKSDIVVFFGDVRVAATIAHGGERIIGTKMDPAIAKTVLGSKKEHRGEVQVFGKNFQTIYLPLVNPENEAFASIAMAVSLDEMQSETKAIIRDGLTIGLVGLAIAIAALFLIISTISHPVIVLSKIMNLVANGNLGVTIDINRDDEVGLLSKSVKKTVDTISKLLVDINTMIVEQKRGNTDYTMSTDQFQGDYRLLVENILELAYLGMRDQLTGIPNRRSFDNRMSIEWSRAIRDKSYIAILMLDVDWFKNYNDTFGHPQGDIALKTVARTLKHSIKRSVDLAARWGGEEFIIYLPDTDPKGALCLAERIRVNVEGAQIPYADPRAANVTVSIGVHVQIPSFEESAADAIDKADKALYEAKNAGRNRVALYIEPTPGKGKG